jgi:hypothetical protein
MAPIVHIFCPIMPLGRLFKAPGGETLPTAWSA